MTQAKTQYTISAAHRITGRSRTTIQRHIKKGRLSFTEDADGNKLIDASELIRVYGDDCDFSKEADSASGREEGGPTQDRLHSLQQRVDSLEEERRRERQQLQAQIEHLQDALKLAQEGHNKATLLLEDRSRGGEWRQAVERLESQLAEQRDSIKREAEAAALERLKDRPWWALLRSDPT